MSANVSTNLSEENAIASICRHIFDAIIFIYLYLYGVIRACIPFGWLPRKDISGQVVVVTGAGGGLGRLLSLGFAKAGAKLVLCDIDSQATESTARAINKLDLQSASVYICDISDYESVNSVATKIYSDHQHVDIVVNNAGICGKSQRIQDTQPDSVVKVFAVNAFSHVWTMKAFLPGMIERKCGHFVCIASAGGLTGCADTAIYSASKFAAIGLCESLAVELSAYDQEFVKTTIVCPYYLNTKMFNGIQTQLFALPVMDAEIASDKIIDAVLTESKYIFMPKMVYPMIIAKAILPSKALIHFGKMVGHIQPFEKMFHKKQK